MVSSVTGLADSVSHVRTGRDGDTPESHALTQCLAQLIESGVDVCIRS